jgi:hypothetical protein
MSNLWAHLRALFNTREYKAHPTFQEVYEGEKKCELYSNKYCMWRI